jgi:hypothetical protein
LASNRCRVLTLLGAAAGSRPYMLRAAGSGKKKGHPIGHPFIFIYLIKITIQNT